MKIKYILLIAFFIGIIVACSKQEQISLELEDLPNTEKDSLPEEPIVGINPKILSKIQYWKVDSIRTWLNGNSQISIKDSLTYYELYQFLDSNVIYFNQYASDFLEKKWRYEDDRLYFNKLKKPIHYILELTDSSWVWTDILLGNTYDSMYLYSTPTNKAHWDAVAPK